MPYYDDDIHDAARDDMRVAAWEDYHDDRADDCPGDYYGDDDCDCDEAMHWSDPGGPQEAR